MAATPATQALQRAGVSFKLHEYDYDPDAESIGLAAAASLGVEPERMLKTLIVRVDGKFACVVLPSDREVSMKRLAAALKGKSAEMAKPADAERATGFKVGGVSPFGQKRPAPTVLDASALGHATVFVNGGRRGLQAELDPKEIVRVLGAVPADVT
jgi:Cys-tRNA(Pro)/Cys-tRNA(Cys) deacylase